MERITKDSIRQLQAETGHVLCVDDFDLIQALDLLGKRVVDPLDSDNESILHAPRIMSGVVIYPMYISRAHYIETVLANVVSDDMNVFAFAVAWACSVENCKELWSCVTKKDICEKVESFMRSCKWTADDAEKFFADIFSQHEHDENGERKHSKYGAVVSLLTREYGSTPEYWMNSATPEMIETLLNDFQRRQDAEIKAMTKGNSKGMPFFPTLKGVSVSRYNREVNRIRKLWQPTQQD